MNSPTQFPWIILKEKKKKVNPKKLRKKYWGILAQHKNIPR
jgi:hypothetical protein